MSSNANPPHPVTELEPLLAAIVPHLPLLLRMTLVALFVVTIAVIAERMGAFIGGMIASLPLYTGPVYLLLALEHDETYLAAAAIGSLTICGASAVFALGYCVAARHHGTLASLAFAYTGWGVCAALAQSNDWGLIEALLIVTPIYLVAVPMARGYTRGVAMRRAERRWMDLPLRAILVASLSGLVVTLSSYLPPRLTGILSVMPILLTSLILVMHPRVGGAATAALLAHTLGGLIGMIIAFVVVHLTIRDWGAALSLGTGLAITVGWNVMLILVRQFAGSRR